MKDQLIKVANELSDLAAAYEEKVTQKTWIDAGWKDLLGRLAEYSDDLCFQDDTSPTEVVHELFMRVQEIEGGGRKKKFTYSTFNWPGPEALMQQQAAMQALRNPVDEFLQVARQEAPMAQAAAQLEQDRWALDLEGRLPDIVFGEGDPDHPEQDPR